MQVKQTVLVCSLAAPEDAAWLTQWEKHLLPLQRAGHLHLWSERLLLAGQDRVQQMNQQVDQADLIVLLISPDFFASEECLTLAEQALTRRQNEPMALVPLLLRPSAWQDSPLGSLTCLPVQARPVASWSHVDEAFLECVAGLRQLLGLPVGDIPKQHQLSFSSTQRLQVICALQQEYRQRRDHSLQGRVAIELGLHERTDVIASSARLVFHDSETERPLPTGTSIIQVYDNAQRGLLILGAPGAGKTTLLLDLVLDLLQRAENDSEHPLPIILSLSSWGASKLTFVDWLREQLYLVYGITRKVGTSWIEQDQILFLLDGLDEMDLSKRSACIAAINHYRSEHFAPLVVSSRSREYEQQQARLILAAAVEIQPLESTRVLAHLKQAGQSLAAVRTVLQNNTMLQSLITTPLLLMIVLLTYRNQESNELAQLESPEDQQRLIFQHYIQQMLRRHHHRRTVSRPHLLRSLYWLAQTMQKQHLTEFYLEQLQPTWLATKRLRTISHLLSGLLMGLLAGLLFGSIIGLLAGFATGKFYGFLFGLYSGFLIALVIALVTSLGFGLLKGLLVGLISGLLLEIVFGLFHLGLSIGPLIGQLSGLLAGLLTERGKNKLAEKVVWSWRGCGKGALFGLIGGLILELLSPSLGLLYDSYNLSYLLISGLVYGLILGLIFGLFGSLSGAFTNPGLPRLPAELLAGQGKSKLIGKVTWSWRQCGKGVLFGFMGELILKLLLQTYGYLLHLWYLLPLEYILPLMDMLQIRRLVPPGEMYYYISSLLYLLISGLIYGLILGLIFGLFGGVLGVFTNPGLPRLLAGLLTERGKNKLAGKVTWSWRGCGKGALFGLIGGLILGQIPPTLLVPSHIPESLTPALISGLILGLTFGLFGGLSSTSVNPDLRRRPNQGIHMSGWNAIRFSLVFLLAFGLPAGVLIGWFGGGWFGGLIPGLIVGLLGGWFGGLFGGGVIYLQHYILRFLLWRSNAFPWRAIHLLEEATDCILLQRVGGGYRFIHPLLQEHFASLDLEVILKQDTGQMKSSEEETK